MCKVSSSGIKVTRPTEPIALPKIKPDPELSQYAEARYANMGDSCPAPENLSLPSRENHHMSHPESIPHQSERATSQLSERSSHIPERPVHLSERPSQLSERPSHISERPSHLSDRPSHIPERPTHTPHLTESYVTSRPNSLPLIKRDRTRMLSMVQGAGVSTPNVSMATPSSMAITPSSVFCPGLDSMVDGSTGLTPLTGLSSGLSCSSQTRSSGERETSEATGSPTLISL